MKKVQKLFAQTLPLATIFFILSGYILPLMNLIDFRVLAGSLQDSVTMDEAQGSTHGLSGWSDADLPGNYGGYGSDPTMHYRQIVETDACDDSGREATVTLHAGTDYADEVVIHHLDGLADDGFEVYLGSYAPGNLIGTYTDQHSSETWETSTFTLPYPTGDVTLVFHATGSIFGSCSTYGQVAISWIELYANTPPATPVITWPADGSVLTTDDLTHVDWTDVSGDVPPIEYQYQAFSDANYTINRWGPSGWLSDSEIPTPGTPEGEYYVQVHAHDGNGFETAWSNGAGNPHHIAIDNTSPFVEITSHDDGDPVSGVVDFYGTVTDAHPHHYWAVIQNDSGSTLMGGTVNRNDSFTNEMILSGWDTTMVPDGTYTIKLEARDAAGNKNPDLAPVPSDDEDPNDSVDWVTVIVDNPPEATAWAAPTAPAFFTRNGDATHTGNQVLADMKFLESNSTDVDFYEYQYIRRDLAGTKMGSGITNMNTYMGGITCNAGVCTWSPNMQENSMWLFRMRVVDTQGQRSDWSNWNEVTIADFANLEFNYSDYITNSGVFGRSDYVKANGGFAVREQILPDSEITAPADNTTDDPAVAIEYTYNDEDTEVKQVELWYSYEGTPYALLDTDTVLDGEFDTTLADGNGTYCFYTVAEDIADDLTLDAGVGNRELPPAETCELEIELDMIPPYSEFTAPEDGSYWNTPIPLEGNSEDDETYVSYVTLYWGDYDTDTWTEIETLPNPSDANPYFWTTTWLPSSEGTYDLKVVATDSAGNIETTDYVMDVTYDVTPPAKPTIDTIYKGHDSGTWVEVGCGGYTNSTQISIVWDLNAEPDIAGYWFGTQFNDHHNYFAHPNNVKHGNMTPGHNPYYYTVIAVDLAGNESEPSDPCGLILDQDPPIVDITSHNNGDVLELTETLTGEIIEDNLSHYNLSLYEDPTGTCDVESTWDFSQRIWQRAGSTNSLSHDLDTTAFADGNYMIRLAARDLAGNRDPLASTGTGDSVEVICVEIDNSGSVSGIKYEDINNNGMYDNGEPTLEGWRVYVDENDNDLYDSGEPTDVTDTNGEYLIEDLTANRTYTVREVMENGWMQTEPGENMDHEYSIFIDYAQDRTGYDFGNFELGLIQGRKYMDHDMDGVHDDVDDEPRLDEWTINLYDNSGSIVDTSVTGETGNPGQFRFEAVGPGTYHVCEEMQDGWMQTGPNIGSHPVDYDNNQINDAVAISGPDGVCWEVVIDESGESYGWLKFGNFELATVSGYKWSDEDADGEWDDDEPGLEGWEILLTGSTYDRRLVNEIVTTNEDGMYSFEGLERGRYTVAEDTQDDWQQTYPISVFYIIEVTESGQVFSEHDFGNTELGYIQGRKFQDVNYNGEFDQDEKNEEGNPNRLDDWMIYLYDENWNLIANMLTGDDETPAGNVGQGQYRFEGLVTGTYYVCEEDREGWEQTRPHDEMNFVEPEGSVVEDIADRCFEVSLRAGQHKGGVQFGNFELATISGMKWEDTNVNGTMDEGEDGLNGWEITMDDEIAAVTADDGHYTIAGVGYGEHEICEVMQEGWVQSSEPECHTITVTESGQNFSENNFGNYLDLFPTVTISANPGTTVEEGTTVTLTATGNDGNSPLSYSWSGDCSGTGTTKTVPNTPGTYVCSVTVTDIDGDTDMDTITVTVNAREENNAGGDGNNTGGGGNADGGIGGPGFTGGEVLAAENDEDEDEQEYTEEDEGEVLGELTCSDEQKTKVSGHVYYDKNNNEEMDDGEDGQKDIEIELVTEIDGEEVSIEKTVTDENGYYELEVCPANYKITVNAETLPENVTLKSDDVLSVSVSEGSELADLDFELEQSESGFNWWLCIIPLIILFALVLLYIFASRRAGKDQL